MKAFILLVLFMLTLPTFASVEDMRDFVQITNGNIYSGHVPTGYRSKKLEKIVVRGGLEKFLRSTTEAKMKDWKNLVRFSPDYSDLSAAERRRISTNPLAELQVEALLEVSEVYAIYKGNKLIGYAIEIIDHVQAAIYQDGAWYDCFFDAELNLVEAFEHSA